MIFWRGAVDEVRISRGARYSRNFTPPATLTQDGNALLALSNDRQVGPFVPVDGEVPVQAVIKGQPRLAPAER
jgi:hypothetical protein